MTPRHCAAGRDVVRDASSTLLSPVPQIVDETVDVRGRDVEFGFASARVHRPASGLRTTRQAPSTFFEQAQGPIFGRLDVSSPASTDAKTTDENLYLNFRNDKNPVLVESGDESRIERSMKGSDE